MSPEILSPEKLFFTLDRIRQQGFTNIVKIESPEGSKVIAVNPENKKALVWHQISTGTYLPATPCNLAISNSKTNPSS